MSRWIFPCLLLLAPLLRAQEADVPVAPADILDQVVVYGREEDLVGSASSPSEGDIGSAELAAQPFFFGSGGRGHLAGQTAPSLLFRA